VKLVQAGEMGRITKPVVEVRRCGVCGELSSNLKPSPHLVVTMSEVAK
jgi:hypothetical protein